MNILLLTGPLYPKAGNNTNLLAKLIPSLGAQNTLQLLSAVPSAGPTALPDRFFGIPALWARDDRRDLSRKMIYPLLSKSVDRRGYSDYLSAKLLYDTARKHSRKTSIDAVISTMEPFPYADAASRIKNAKKILYLMDPPACISNGRSTPYRDRRMKKLLSTQDAILTTPFIREALIEHGFGFCENKLISVGFPMIEAHGLHPSERGDGRIRLLFCGWLYSDIRSPKYFLDIISRLDERFEVTFMGKECQLLQKRFPTETRASLITLPQQPYETALQAMADADILINVGNSVPVHMPSKTLEYINTGKPFVNFYKLDDCPTLYYTKRYPLCLNMSEGDSDLDAAAQRFVDFCVTNKGKAVDRSFIEREYEDCTPAYIAGKILDVLGE